MSGAAFRPFGTMGKGFFLIGHGGLYLPRFTLAGTDVSAERFIVTFYYVIAAAFYACAWLIWRITCSRSLRACFLGLDVPALRLIAFVIPAGVMAVAGALFGQPARQITPQQVGWFFSAEIAVATVLGGTRRLGGPLVGAFAMVALRKAAVPFPLGYRCVLGALLIAVVFLAPGGLAAVAAQMWARGRGAGCIACATSQPRLPPAVRGGRRTQPSR